ncbi:FAD-dependent thymidylate synthase [Sulfurimonas sp. HSL-1716]|uniref:FAD-dependent thymidylate synthase n=1 Tax=Hydrocurvibacter sulfurireducens TaxID=3131937 RepID=UPI0031F86D8E
MYGINYSKPEVVLLQNTGIGVAEAAARTCYDSFENSENEVIKCIEHSMPDEAMCCDINAIEESSLLDDLAWTYFHHSILEHANLSYLIRGTSRGVLQEHARHRIQAISVRSTRYTMSSVINAFVASLEDADPKAFFTGKVLAFDMLVTSDEAYNRIEIGAMFDKLLYQLKMVEDFYSIAVAKSSLPLLDEHKGASEALFDALQKGKKKRNVGDAFKHIVTDNLKVDMVVTFNLRSLKNYFTLRDSGAAYFQIKWLAQEMMKVTPKKYLDLIIKKGKSDA